MRPLLFVFFTGFASSISMPAAAELVFQQNQIAGVSAGAVLNDGAAQIASSLGVPTEDLAQLRSGQSLVLDNLSKTETQTYEYFKRLYPDFETDFASDFTNSFATSYSSAWTKINLEGQSVTMGTGFAHDDLQTRLPARTRLPLTARLIVDPRNDFAPGGLSKGNEQSIKVIILDEDGQRWLLDLSENGRNEWQVDTPVLADAADGVTLDPNSAARVGSRLVAISSSGDSIWVSDNDGADWRKVARNDPAFDEGRKDVMRGRGFDDARLRAQVIQLFESLSDEREMPSAAEIEDLVWNKRRSVQTIHAFRSHPTDPDLVYASFSGGNLGELRLDNLISTRDSFAAKTEYFSAPYLDEWNGNKDPVADFSVRPVATSGSGQGAATVRRAAMVLPQDARPRDILARSEEDFNAWRRDVLDSWGPSSIAVFSDSETGFAFERTSSQDLKAQFRRVFHGGDGQITYAVDDIGTLFYSVDLDSRATDNSTFDLARERASDEVERARQAFNQGVKEAKDADRPLPHFTPGFPTLRTYNTISQLHWTPLDRDLVAATGTKSGVWVLLHSGRMRHYQAPPLSAATQGNLRPAPDALLTLKSMLSDAIQERDLLAGVMDTYLAGVADTRRLTALDLAKFRLALRLEAGGFTSRTTTVGGDGTPTGDAILSGVAALVSEVPFAATFLNIANFALGQARSASDTPRVIANPQAAGFSALQVAAALDTELKTAFNQREQAIRFARQVCLASPRTRAACLDQRGLISQPSDPLKASGYATQYLPAVAAQNILQSRYISQVRIARAQARCLMWQELLPRMGFLYGGTITPGYSTFEVDDREDGKFTGIDDGTSFVFGPLGAEEPVVPFMVTQAFPPILNKIEVATAWTLRTGTLGVSAPLVRTALDTDGLAGDFVPGPIGLPLNGPNQLGVSDIFFSCGTQGAKALLGSLDRYTEGVTALESFTVNSGGKRWGLPRMAEDFGFPDTQDKRDDLMKLDSFETPENKVIPIAGPVARSQHYFGGTSVWPENWLAVDAIEKQLP
ncbi:hypothetical protein [Pelagimonas varians]|uniref:Uncharacterized protein n=1 Tax=Pelagimonas varians TaxID=696760 RepID=A0A238KWA3_9RHOB|nr:hypothetical protein [Pelagimonas varians]PYG28064.1 hypothetical protein C8N36_11396 [Pelagimonas varians]SMX46861.1 hypothetical protein PEV8663_03406 [Pelagimonas varians]